MREKNKRDCLGQLLLRTAAPASPSGSKNIHARRKGRPGRQYLRVAGGGAEETESAGAAVTKMAEFCIFFDNCGIPDFKKVIILTKPGHKRGGKVPDLVL